MRRLALIGPAALLALALSVPAAAADNAMVRVLHGSPDAPAVDVYLDGAKVGAPLAGLEFGDLIDYVAVPAGDHAIKVCAAADDTVCPIDVPSISLTAGTKYTIAATNNLDSIEAQVIEDTSSTSASEARVRVVHFSADTPAVDVLTQDGSAKVVENLSYPNATEYLALEPGSYDLKVCANADNTLCPLDPGALDLAADRAYSVFAIGSLEGETLTAAVGVDAAGMPATDTVTQTDGQSGTSAVPAALAVLVAAAAALVVAVRRFAPDHADR